MTELTPDQEYFNDVIEKFKENNDHEKLSDIEKILTKQILDTEQLKQDMANQLSAINSEIDEKQNKARAILEKILTTQGRIQGFVDSLLALKSDK